VRSSIVLREVKAEVGLPVGLTADARRGDKASSIPRRPPRKRPTP
jgi:hypothetical protein